MTKNLLLTTLTCWILISPTQSRADGVPEIPLFDLSDLRALNTESIEQREKWLDYQSAMNTAFSETTSFIEEDGVQELKIQAAERFLEVFGQIDNPHSSLDNDQVKALSDYIYELSIESAADTRTEDYAEPLSESASNTQLISEPFLSEFESKLTTSCAQVFEHCAVVSQLNLPPLVVTDSEIRFEPQLAKVGEKWFRLVDDSTSTAPYSGLVRGFLPDGQLTTELNFKDGTLSGMFKRWWPNGVLAVEGRNERGLFSGEYKEWYSDGQLRKSSTMRRGVPIKKETLWYPSGTKKAEVALSNRGSLNGRTIAWYPSGQLYFDGRFSLGAVLEEHRIFHPNGQLALKYSPIETVACIGDRLRTNCPNLSMMLVKKEVESYDSEGKLLWSSNSRGITTWGDAGELMHFEPNSIEEFL